MRNNLVLVLLALGIVFSSCQKKEIHPTVIIGGGLMGSSALWQLSKQGKKAILLEQQGDHYKYGSSQGKSRIARSLGPEGDMWGWLHDGTVQEVKELVQYLNEKEGNDFIQIDQIYNTSPVTYVRHIKQLERIEALMYDDQPDEYKFAGNPTDARKVFGMNTPDSVIVIREYKPHSGTINPEELIPAAHHASLYANNPVRYHTQVNKLTKENDHYRIDYTDLQTNKKDYLLANKVISAAGPWTGKLLEHVAPSMNSLLNPQRVFLSYIRIKPAIFNALSEEQKNQLINGYPLINSSLGTRLGSNFSMIDRYDNGIPIIKIGGHFQRSEVTSLDSIWQQKLSAREIDWSMNRVHQYLTYLNLPISRSDIEVADTYSCVYTLTNNEVPYISYAVNADGSINKDLIIMAGLSGVGGKGSLMYGQMAANLIQEIQPSGAMEAVVHSQMGIERLKKDME